MSDTGDKKRFRLVLVSDSREELTMYLLDEKSISCPITGPLFSGRLA